MYFAIHVLQDYKGQKLAEQIFQGIILVSAVCHHSTWKHDMRFSCSLLIITTDVAPAGNWICLWADHWTVWVDSLHSPGWIYCVLCGELFAFTQCYKWGTQFLNYCLFCVCLLWKALNIQNHAFFFSSPLADPASVANVQEDSFVLAATHCRS